MHYFERPLPIALKLRQQIGQHIVNTAMHHTTGPDLSKEHAFNEAARNRVYGVIAHTGDPVRRSPHSKRTYFLARKVLELTHDKHEMVCCSNTK